MTNRLFVIFTLAAILLAVAAGAYAQESHEYAPLQERTLNYQDWTFKSLKDDKAVDLRTFAQGKRLVLVVYFAPWCPNWHYEAPVAARLYDKYKAQGFDVIGVSEYGTRDEVRAFFGPAGPPYTVVTESEVRAERDKTSHFTYRQATEDKRKWGSPYNIFIEPARLSPSGSLLTEKAWVANGELIEADVDKFVRERLEAKPVTQAIKPITQTISPCKQ